jgi:hypothetical protein
MPTHVTENLFHVAVSNAEQAIAKQCVNDEFENTWK